MKELKTILDEKQFIEELNEKLKNGGVIAFVTDTVWGLGCLPANAKGVDKIYGIKGRDRTKPLILMSDCSDKLFPYTKNITKTAKNLITEYFPGALTVILEKSDKTPLYVTANKNTVGIRVPDNKFFKKLCSVIDGGVLATTSANFSNHPSAKTYEEAKSSIGEFVDFVFQDYGYCAKGLESTVVLATDDNIKVLRQGAIILNQINHLHQLEYHLDEL